MNILFHLKALWSKVVAWFGATKKVRLSVVGFTASGKTYLQTDVVGALEKLGFRCDDRYANDHLQRDVYNLIEEMDRDGAVGKSLVKACRQEDVYLSRFLDLLGVVKVAVLSCSLSCNLLGLRGALLGLFCSHCFSVRGVVKI